MVNHSLARDLLASADAWAKQTLTESYDMFSAPALLRGWGQVVEAAAAAWEAIPQTAPFQTSDIATGNALPMASLTATEIVTEARDWIGEEPSPATARIAVLLQTAAQAIHVELPAGSRPDAHQAELATQLRAGLLHVGSMVTHAAAVSVAQHADLLAQLGEPESDRLANVATRLRGIEQGLDASLYRRPTNTAPTPQIGEVDHRLQQFMQVAYRRGTSADPATNVVVADIARRLIGHSAQLARDSAQQGRIKTAEYTTRLAPALKAADEQWDIARKAWVHMSGRHDRANPEIVKTANQLIAALEQPELGAHPAIATTMTSALVAAAELAQINHQATTDPDLMPPTAIVVALTKQALKEEPSQLLLIKTWARLESQQGLASMPLPELLRDQREAQSQTTIDASLAARSAGHVLADRSGYHPLLALRQGQTAPVKPPPTPPPGLQRHPTGPRIG